MPTVRRFRMTINGKVYEVEAEELTPAAPQAGQPAAFAKAPNPPIAPVPEKRSQPQTAKGVGVDAPLPGLVLDVKVTEGQSVETGQVLVILEAMKMENEIVAPDAGVVESVHVSKGDSVSAGDVLVVLK